MLISNSLYESFNCLDGPRLVYMVGVPTRFRSPLLHKAVESMVIKRALHEAVGFMVGKRILAMDIFEMEGHKISACNQDYLDVAIRAKYTAPVIQRLIDRGGVIVGKARLSSLMSREEVSENLDYASPMNPRGDGKQSPAGSSSGSAVGVAAYDWIDFSIGIDCKLLMPHRGDSS